MPHDYRLEGAKRLLSTYRPHRHRQLRLLKDLVVLGILRERGKLCEPRPHPARLGISGGKEIPGGLVRLTRIGREVVPYSVKVDTLPACDQSLRIRSMEVEVPNARIQENFV